MSVGRRHSRSSNGPEIKEFRHITYRIVMEKRHSHLRCAAVCSTAAPPYVLLYRCYCKRYGNGVVCMADECLKGKKVMLREKHLSQTLIMIHLCTMTKALKKLVLSLCFIHNLMILGIFSFDHFIFRLHPYSTFTPLHDSYM